MLFQCSDGYFHLQSLYRRTAAAGTQTHLFNAPAGREDVRRWLAQAKQAGGEEQQGKVPVRQSAPAPAGEGIEKVLERREQNKW